MTRGMKSCGRCSVLRGIEREWGGAEKERVRVCIYVYKDAHSMF